MRKSNRSVDYEPISPGQQTAVPVGPKLPDLVGEETEFLSVRSEALLPNADFPVMRNHQGKVQLSRGHLLSYCGLLVFTLVVYFRPQETYPALASVPVAFIAALLTLLAFIPSQLMLEGTLTSRPREVNLMLLLAVAALLSVPLAISPIDALNIFWDPFLKAVIVFIIIINVVRTEQRLRGMFYLAFAVTCSLCFTALNDYRLGKLTVEGYRISGYITGGMFDNSNDLGIHLVTMLPLAFTLGFATRNVVGKILYWGIALLALSTLVITFSRGAFIGLLASAVVMSWKLARRRRAVVIGFLIVAVPIFIAAVPGSYWLRLMSIFDASLDKFGSGTARSEMLLQSFVVALKRPLFGIGIGNFSLFSARGLVSHNSYTQVASEMGLAALLLYAMFVTAPLNRLRKIEHETRSVKSDSRFYYLAVGLQGSLIGYMFSSFFVSVAYYWFVYYLVGYAVCFRRIYDAQAKQQVFGGTSKLSEND